MNVPEDYDLEHAGDTADIEFFVNLTTRLKPRRVLELACGSGRMTIPLAEAGAKHKFDVFGIDIVPEMLQAAKRRAEQSSEKTQSHLTLSEGDMRTWRSDESFDVIVTPCGSVPHLHRAIYGDYNARPIGTTSSQMILVGRKSR